MDSIYKGLPLQGLGAREIIIQLFEEQNMWQRADLIKAVVSHHEANGGVIGKQDPTMVVKKALTNLKEEGRLASPAIGIWVKVGSNASNVAHLQSEEVRVAPISPLVSGDEEDVEEIEILSGQASPTIGSGSEAVYLYFNPSEKELAGLKGQSNWECKIGMTTTLPVEARIFSQGVKTAFSKAPVIGLVIKSDNAFRLEKALHHALHMAGAEAPESLGSEWFLTNPEKIHAWYESFIAATEKLKS